MIQRRFYLLCCAVLLCIASQDQMSGQGTSLQPPASPAIQVYLTASGNNDSTAVPAQSELITFIDKQPAQIISLRSAKEDKLLFALLVDISKSEAPNAESIKKAAMLLFQSLATGENQGYIVVFDVQALKSQIPLPPPEARKAIEGLKFGGGTSLYDAIWETCRDILSRTRNPDLPRRAIILISDGEDNSSNINHTKAEEIAITNGVAIFSLAIPNPSGERILSEISNSTGGKAIFDKNLEEGVTPLLTAIKGQWVLSLVPQQTPDHKLHSLSVKTTQRHVSLSVPAKILLR